MASLDDFYIIEAHGGGDGSRLHDSRLGIVETSYDVLGEDIYYDGSIHPKKNLCWVRLMMANWLSCDGQQWVSSISDDCQEEGGGDLA